MPVTTFYFDLDDTLYPPSTGVWTLIRQRIDLFIHEKFNLPWEEVTVLRRSLFEEFGTTMRGLQQKYQIDEQEYLAFVHDVPVERLLQPDPVLHQLLKRYPQRKVIFTNADANHARRVLKALTLEDLFDLIIDISTLSPSCKPQMLAFQTALQIAGVTNPEQCILIDDQITNVTAGRRFGMNTVLVSNHFAGNEFTPSIPTLHDLPKVFPY
jgi:putative hydrolase of the HAD superfamily